MSENFPNATVSERNRLTAKRYLELRESINTDGFEGLKKIAEGSEEYNFTVSFFIVDAMPEERRERIYSIASGSNLTVIEAPEEFRDDVRSTACLKYNFNRVSPVDPHPSAIGHRVLARPLTEFFLQGEGQYTSFNGMRIIQFIDPC